MAEGTQFPQFIVLREDPGNAQVYDQFVRKMADAGNRAKDSLSRSMSGVRDTIAEALAIPRNAGGSLDLNIAQLREMERQSEAVAKATREYALASKQAAISSGENSRARNQEIRAAFELARAEESSLAALRTKIRVLDQVQAELNQTASATDIVIGRNNDLARSLQDVARAANVAERSQRNVNSLSAPGLDPFRAAKNNGATYSALAEMLAQQEAAQKLQQELDSLRRAEASAVEGANLLAAAHRGTALEIGRSAKSARESAQTFEIMFQAMDAKSQVNGQNFFNTALGIDQVTKSARASASVFEEMFAAEERAAQAARDHASAASQLRSQLDPTLRLQERFDAEMVRADSLLEAGAISQREYGQAVAFARQQLADGYQALFREEEALKRGTDAWGIHAHSMRGSRQAMVQTGQQLQDVAISLYGGQRATVVFAQQIPQLLFALTSLEGSANKTASKIGSMATLLSGPWSLAVVAGAAVLGYLVDQLFNTEDASDKAGKSTLTLADALDKNAFATDAARKALEEYNAEQDRARKSTEDMIKLNLASAEARLKDAIATREQLAAELRKAEADALSAGRGMVGEEARYARLAAAGTANIARGRAAENDAKIATLQESIGNLRIQDATRDAKAAVDPFQAINNKYDDMAAAATRAAAGNQVLTASLKGTLTTIEKMRQRDLDSLRESRKTSRKSSGLGTQLWDYGSPIPGAPITSGYGIRKAPKAGASSVHQAVDYGAAAGTPVLATQDGVVVFAEKYRGYGNQVRIGHGGGTETRYSHLDSFSVNSGDMVKKGQMIGRVGSTGVSTGPHLDYQVLVNGKKVDPTKGKFPFDPDQVLDAADKAADALQEFGDRSAEKISRINEAFDEQPRLIDRANQATRELDATIAELTERKPEGWQQLVADAQAAKGTIQDALVRPFREMREESEKRITVQRLLTAGREDEAEALDRIWSLEKSVGPLTAERKQEVLSLVRYEREVNEELAARQEIINSYLDATRSVKQELVSIFSGDGSFANLGKIFRNLQGQVIVEKLFGNAFRDFDKWVKGESGLADSVDYFTAEADNAGAAAGNLASALNGAASVIRNPALSAVTNSFDSLTKAVNDNFFAGMDGAEITVKGAVPGKDSAMGMTPERYFAEMSKQVVDPLLSGLDSIFGVKFFGKLSGALSGAMNGYLTGGPAGGILGALKGIEGLPAGLSNLFGKGLGGSQTGTMVAGLGNALGIKLNSTGAQIGGAIGSMLPIPGGDIIGSIAGGLIGNLVGKRPRGAAEVSNSSVYGHTNDSALTDSISGWGGQVQDAVKSIADALGAEIGAYSIGLGRYKDYYQVSSKAGDPRLGNSYFGRDSQNAVYDGLDAEAAMAAAIGAVLAQGAIKGISAASQKILTSAASKDLQAAIEKAVLIESIPKRLKRLTDPVGSAIDELNKEFEKMVAALKEGGATAEQFADAQKLYDLERAAAIEQATASVTNSLRSLLDELTVGNDALALRDRRSAALAAYDPLRARVAAGDTTAYDKFADAARSLLDIERQMFGSQSGYFDRLNEVTGLTRTALAAQEALIAGSTGAPSPFSSAANDNVVSSLDAQTGVLQGGFDTLAGQLAAVNQNLGTLIQLNLAAGGGTLFTPGGVVNY